MPSCIDVAGSDVDVNELCKCLQGPVLHYSEISRAFEAGSWTPAGLVIEAKLNGKCATGVGKRTAEVVLQHFVPKKGPPSPERTFLRKAPSSVFVGQRINVSVS